MKNAAMQQRLSSLIEQYLASRGHGTTPISTSRAVRAITTVMSDCPASDRELQNLIAKSAIERGYDVHFDLGGAVDELPVFRI